jgi:U2-associated protein SR140
LACSGFIFLLTKCSKGYFRGTNQKHYFDVIMTHPDAPQYLCTLLSELSFRSKRSSRRREKRLVHTATELSTCHADSLSPKPQPVARRCTYIFLASFAQRDEQEAAKIYKEFLKDFASDEDEEPEPAAKTFLSGGVVQAGKDGKARTSHRRHFLPPNTDNASAITSSKAPGSSEPAAVEQPGSATAAGSGGVKPRHIDLLLEDLKRGQAERDQRRESGIEEAPDSGTEAGLPDGLSTNLFVGNLAPDIDEHALLREFGRFGPIGSVKVMWPRDDEQRRRGKNTGFVAFMRREDAERARNALDGITLRGLVLAVGWGKTVPLPAIPVWPPTGGVTVGLDGNAGAPALAPLAPESTRQRMHDGPPPKAAVIGRGRDIEVDIPSDPRLRFVVDAMAFYVARDGCDFEQAVMERENGNPEFSFLYNIDSPEHIYYRWRIYSLSSGDNLRSWRVDPFLMVENSMRWMPPPMTLAAMAANKAAVPQREDSALPDLAREKLIEMLNNLTVDRQAIADAMVFAIDHVDHAADVTDMLLSGLIGEEMPGPVRVARLFVLSDILHNTSAQVRNASRYRTKLQEALPDVFEALSGAYRNAEGRMAQEKLRKHVLQVLRVWRGWYIFSDDFINGLQATFLRSGVGLDGRPITAEQSLVDAAAAAALAALTDEELELRCKHRGLSRKGGRQGQVARLLALDAYLMGGDRPAKAVQQKQEEKAGQDAATKGGGDWIEVDASSVATEACEEEGGQGNSPRISKRPRTS